MSTMQRPRGGTVVKVVVGVVIVCWSLFPIYWAAVLSLSTKAEINKVPVSFFPETLTWENYGTLLGGTTDESSQYLRALLNSTIEAFGVTALTLVLALPAAYAFVRLHSRLSKIAFLVVIFMMAVPGYFLLVPLFQIASTFHQVDTYQVIIVILCTAVLPLAVWILRSHIESIPVEIENAARLDGASTFTLLTRIIAPLVAPGCIAAGAVAFLGAWGAFLLPVVFASGQDTQPLTVLIPNFATKVSLDYGLQAAGAIIALLPPAILVVLLRRYLITGLLAGRGK